ncbi:unnamed protein product [Symbiodinium microadriaticum]|nr:unnamed protein product [Symbiodinium microadriaticum]
MTAHVPTPPPPPLSSPIVDMKADLSLNPSNSILKLSMRVIAVEEDIKKAHDNFKSLLIKKQLSQHPTAICKGVFARVWQSEVAVLNQLEAMGIRIIEAEDVTLDRIPPYVEVGRGNPAVPSFKVWFSLTPPESLTFNYTVSAKKLEINGAKSMILKHIDLLLQFLGNIADIQSQPTRRTNNEAVPKQHRKRPGEALTAILDDITSRPLDTKGTEMAALCDALLDHAISAPFTVVDGVAQGKKASVHKFNTAAAFIKDYISQHILGAAIPTGTWQHRVLQHAEHIKPARYGQHDASLGPRLAPDASAARISVRSFAGEVAKLAFYADRVACVHPRD